MSHFNVAVMIPRDTPVAEIEATVGRMIAKYDENTQGPEREVPCYCVGMEASRDANEQTDRALGPLDPIRDKYWATPEDERPDWDALVAPRIAYRERVRAEHPNKDKPQADCEECGGTGTRSTEYNEFSKWDWWVIGGRWFGAFTPDGEREDLHWNDDRIWGRGALAEQLRGNICPVRELPQDFTPFAVVTPDGEWHEKGQMGWFGISIGDKEREDWRRQVRETFSAFPDALVVSIDCHI